MTSAWSQLEQMLTCAICLDKFKNPRLLPCQHSFCGDACMEGLVDYARRQIKCPECRAEHRIPYQGVSSLPSNVTLIRFLELHSRITGEEPEPVPTFMEKCSVCGEKVDGVQRCWHCEKKVCPECKEAHLDLLRREINRINGQSKRCLSKMQEFIKETLEKSEDRLKSNHKQVRNEIEESCKRLIDDLKVKQKKLLAEVDSFSEQEQKVIDKLKISIVDELEILELNTKLADDKIISNKYQWTDQELTELKEIYTKAMEFVRLFDPEIGDFSRKIRFNLIPEFDTLRRRICDIGELKFTETASSLIANSLQYCNATGQVAIELYNAASAQQAASFAATGAGGSTLNTGYGLAHSNSNTNLGASSMMGGAGGLSSTMLELPTSMQNSLMRSQSDHRLASQFQQRLKQQQLQQQQQDSALGAGKTNGPSSALGAGSGRYAALSASSAARDYETDSLRSRYAPTPRAGTTTSTKDYTNDHLSLTRDWPRPSDTDVNGTDSTFGSSIHFKSAFMRRKEKERQHMYDYDDDDLTSEASYGGLSGRNVRFSDNTNNNLASDNQLIAINKQQTKLFDCKEVEHAPLSGIPKLDDSPHLLSRLHQMGAKAIVDKKLAEEEGKRDKDLMESSRQNMNKAKDRKSQRQMSEDEIEKQKRENQQRQQQQQPAAAERQNENLTPTNDNTISSSRIRRNNDDLITRDDEDSSSSLRHSPTPTADLNSSTSTVVEVGLDNNNDSGADRVRSTPTSSLVSSTQPTTTTTSTTTSTTTTTTSSSVPGSGAGRRNLYGQAVTEKSKRQLSSAVQDAALYSRSRVRGAQAAASSSNEGEQTPDGASTSSNGSLTNKTKRSLRSTGRSLSKQTSQDGGGSVASGEVSSSTGTPTTTRRRRLVRGESSTQQASMDSPPIGSSTAATATTTTAQLNESKNYMTGSGGLSDNNHTSTLKTSPIESLSVGQQARGSSPYLSKGQRSLASADQTSTTTEEDEEEADDRNKLYDSRIKAGDYRKKIGSTTSYSYQSGRSSSRATAPSSDDSDDDDDDDQDDVDDDDDNDYNNKESDKEFGKRNVGNRRSREMLPNSVNKLLDRSAQIRRDSQEQRSRGDSPQRSTGGGGAAAAATTTTTSTASSRIRDGGFVGGTTSSVGNNNYSSKSSPSNQDRIQSSFYGGASSNRGSSSNSGSSRRFAYQRSQSIRDSQQNNDDDNNSNNSIYTTASSSGSHILSNSGSTNYGRRRSSIDDDHVSALRKSSGNSTDRTLTSSFDYHNNNNNNPTSSTKNSSSYLTRRDSSGDTNHSPPAYQSRFLSRSRTSAALQSTTGSSSNNNSLSNRSHDSTASQDNYLSHVNSNNSNDYDSSTSGRSYLSSRDRFMQSASVLSGSGGAAGSGSPTILSSSTGTTSSAGVGSSSASSNLYNTRSGGSSAGKFTNLLAWRSMLRARFNFPNQ